jgi:uncharacterized protein (DUF342 family)
MDNTTQVREISKENQAFLTLAVKCKFIDFDQEQQVLQELVSRYESDPECTAQAILEDLSILNAEEIKFLISIKGHFNSKMLDMKFGKLAVANKFTTSDVVKKAMDHQTDHFRKTRRHIPLGDILVLSKDLSEAEKTAILLTQDRIEDRFLQEAMNTLATSELEKLEINKRFGSIAVKNRYADIDSVNKALKIQKEEIRQKGKKRFLGEILEKKFGMPAEHTIEILKVQKIIEKKRLALEKALYRYNSEIRMNQTLSKLFEYRVSKDKLEAYVRINCDFEEDIRPPHLMNWVRLMGIRHGIVDEQQIEAFLSEAVEGAELKIAQGEAAQKGVDASIEFHFDQTPDSSEDKAPAARPVQCRKGEVVATRVPHVEGKPGTNVFGQTILPPPVETCEYRCGKGVEIVNGHQFAATQDGSPVLYANQVLFVTPPPGEKQILQIAGNIDESAADAYRDHHLEVTGDVTSGTILKCRGLKLSGSVFGCIECDDDVEVDGGIGAVPVHNNSDSRARIKTRGSLSVSRRVECSTIECGRYFRAAKADIIESMICANHGIFAKNVYSGQKNPCILQLGVPPNQEIEKLESLLKKTAEEIERLKYTTFFQQMEKLLFNQVQVQDEYRERQSALAFLINITGNLNLENMGSLGSGFDFIEKNEQINGEGRTGYGIPKQTKAYAYLQEIQKKMGKEQPRAQIKLLKRLAEENHGMYQAAVSATDRMVKEVAVKKGLMEKKMLKNEGIIREKEERLHALTLQKDYLLLQEKMNQCHTIPEIRIKNQVSQGTVIQGRKARLVLDQTIYGVKFTEKRDPSSKSSRIVVSGYYE